jgi:multiple sugar transport system ATP-binding protein
MASVTLKDLTKDFKEVIAVNKVNLEIKDREFLVLVGPSGCGKTTALRMIAGLEEVSSGEIFIEDRKVNEISPKDRDIAMVFQNYALYPHMTVYDNMSFGLKLKRNATGKPWPFNSRKVFSRTEIDRRVNEAARLLGLENLLQRKPKALSGGQRQRVALGRAIVREPKVFLMDEPLSNLDAKLRVQTRAELIKLHRRLGITTIYVTHDQTEAMTMGDRIAVMSAGIVQQCDTPLNLYHKPVNMFVAGFIGSPSMNFAPVTIKEENGKLWADAKAFRLALLPDQAETARPWVGKECVLGIRPEDIHDRNLPGLVAPTAENSFVARVDVVEPLGSDMELYLNADNIQLIAMIDSNTSAKMGEDLEITMNMAKTHLFDKETEKSIY